MMRLSVGVEDNVSPRLKAFGADADKLLRKVLRRTGARYRSHMRKNYLRGQMLGRRTGALYKSVRVRKVRRKNMVEIKPYSPLANIYHNTGPIVIKPKTKQALRWFNAAGEPQFAKEVVLDPRPFVSASFNSFSWRREMFNATTHVINREIRRRFREQS
jgi:hypothetical protein